MQDRRLAPRHQDPIIRVRGLQVAFGERTIMNGLDLDVERGEIRRFVIKCRVDNQNSNRVAQRNGFALEGCLREAEMLNGRYDDVNLYARLFPL